MAQPGLYQGLSPSSRRALGFAQAAAWHRAGHHDTAVEPDDLLVGLLLAHPDADGEARVLLAHFGLTGRDVLSPDYPPLDAGELHRQAASISTDEVPPLSPDVEKVLSSVGDTAHLRDVLGGLLMGHSDLTRRLEERLATAGASLQQLVKIYRGWLDDFRRRQDLSGASQVSSSASQVSSSEVPVGQRLRELLERELPRRPVDVPTYAPDRVGAGEDLVGIRREVDAFAYLLASKAQRPPLAVGLFGDWGSGKSFFMNAVKNRIAAIETQIKDRKQADVPFWKNIRQIEFNAWEYVQGSLWASLIDHIFSALDGQNINLVRVRQEQLQAQHKDATDRAEAQAKNSEKLAGVIDCRKAALDEAKRKREEDRKELGQRRDDELAKTLRIAQRDIWGRQAAALAGKDVTELAAAIGEARTELLRGRGLLGPYWTGRRIAGATLVALVVPGVALAAEALKLPTVVSLLGGLAVLVPAITGLLRSSTGWTRQTLDKLDRSGREIDKELASLDKVVDQAREQLERSEQELAAAKAAEQKAQADAASLSGKLDELTPGRVLGEFLQERSRSDDYRRHLGLLAEVRRDLGKLEDLVRDHNNDDAGWKRGHDGPAPPNRIILYIDDLDRCSSTKVLEVLEAVHLLLAFELFVVVVAVDSRWLSVALTDELRALDANGGGGPRATPQDYLEKIFQLPFWVQPLTADGRRSLVHGLLEGSVHADGRGGDAVDRRSSVLSIGPREQEALTTMLSRRGANPRLDAHLLALTPADLKFMESLAPLLGDTPRRVKRFVNVTQLLLALPPSLERDNQRPPDRSIVAFMAALNSGMPALASQLFDAVEPGSTRMLRDAVDQLADPPADERDRLIEWLSKNKYWESLSKSKYWEELPLGRLATRLDVVRRLTFYRTPALFAHTSPAAGGYVSDNS